MGQHHRQVPREYQGDRVSDEIYIALIGGVVAICAAIIAAWQAVRARKENRTARIEERIEDLNRENRLMWLWCRELIDHIYRGGEPPPPPAPPGLFDREDTK